MIETGNAFVVIHVDLDSADSNPTVEINGMSIWAAHILLNNAAMQLFEELPDFNLTKVNPDRDLVIKREEEEPEMQVTIYELERAEDEDDIPSPPKRTRKKVGE